MSKFVDDRLGELAEAARELGRNIGQRDRDWEEALAAAFNRYDNEPPRPPLRPDMVPVWAERILDNHAAHRLAAWRHAVQDALDTGGED